MSRQFPGQSRVWKFFLIAAWIQGSMGFLAATALADAPAPPQGVSNVGDYCTVFLALKLQPELGITADQAAKLADLKTKQDAELAHVGDVQPGEQPPTSRSISQRARVILDEYGKDTQALLTPGQDAKLQDLFKKQALKTIVIHTSSSRSRVNGKVTGYKFNVQLEYTHFGEPPAEKK